MSWLQILLYFILLVGIIQSTPLSNPEEKDAPSQGDDAAGNNSFPFSVPDMILTEAQKRFFGGESKQGILFSRYPVSKWPNNQIPYSINLLDFTLAQRRQIEDAIRIFNSLTSKLKIVPRTLQQDYVRIISGNGCYSYLGRIGGPQTLSLQRNGCLSSGIIQHEFLHAAGFTHMHNRPDRDDNVTVLFENIPPQWWSQYEKVSSEEFGNQGKYDYYSVMHYPVNAPGTSKPAFEFKDQAVDISRVGQRQGPTPDDIQKVNILYP